MVGTAIFLLIEDDPNDVYLIERAFKETPPAVRLYHVSDGSEAVRYLDAQGNYADRSKYPLPKLILLDLKLTGFSGFDFLKWLRSFKRDNHRLIPIIVMSSSSLEEEINCAYDLGVNAYLTKPIDFDNFKERLKVLCAFWAEHVEIPQLHEP